MTRLLLLSALLVTIAACGVSPTSPTSSIAPASDDVTAALVAALQASGARVTELESFNPDPLGGRGIHLCVAGQQVRVYAYGTEAERAAVASAIDPTDPSHIGGTMIVEWAGNPTFWQRDRLIVLYLGSDPAIKAGLTTVLGQPFASGQGRDPGPDAHDC